MVGSQRIIFVLNLLKKVNFNVLEENGQDQSDLKIEKSENFKKLLMFIRVTQTLIY